MRNFDPLTGRFIRIDPWETFNSNYKINKETGCWNWTNVSRVFKNRDFTKHGMSCSRASWILHNGPINSRRIFVCHKCDNPNCVNPDHLFLGSCKDNMQDCKQKGRINKGEDRPQHKLTDETVRQARRMRQEGMPWKKLARFFKVSPTCIGLAVTGFTWSHVDEPIPTFYRKPNWIRSKKKEIYEIFS